MYYVYGAMMPLRVLEEIRFWKMQEREHTEVIRALVPDLEPQFVQLLEQWEGVLAKTEAAAQQLIETVLRNPAAPSDPYICRRIDELLARSKAESKQFINQLFYMLEHSKPIQSNPVIKTVMLHIIRESEYFLGVLQAVTSVGPLRPFQGPASAVHAAPAPEHAGSEHKGPQAFLHVLRQEENPALTATHEGTWTPASSGDRPNIAKPVPIGGHKLPPLPYAYNALEPHIDEKTMRLHHDKHHLSYVEGLNKAEKMMEEARRTGNFDLIKHWEREAAFNGAGHYLHTIFWNVMKPGGGGKATGPIAAEINRTFGSFDAFKKHFTAAADKVEGGGWAILVWSPRSHRVEILQAEKHQNLSQWDVIPLLPLDVWEHAYYLKYNNERPKYIDAWWNVVNWDHVNERFQAAQKLMWLPY